jgi:hypothetical protein
MDWDFVEMRRPWNPDSIPYRDKRFFSLLYSVQTDSGTRLTSHPMGTYPDVKRPRREADHLPPPGVEVKNGGAIHLLQNASSWRGAQ